MKTKTRISIVISLLLGIIFTLTTAFQTNNKLTQEQVINLAEKFIINNGYTSLPAEKSKLSYELLDQYKKNDEEILKGRHNTLHPKAFCISEDKDSWDIGFLSTKVNLNTLDPTQRNSNLSGRAVVVSKDGKEISMAHKDPLFSYFKKL